MSKEHEYFVYILTNPERTVLYTGVTNNLSKRLIEHWENRGKPATFAGKYFCYNLIFFEKFQFITNAIDREKEIKGWRREKKVALINSFNASWTFLNPSVCNGWPPY